MSADYGFTLPLHSRVWIYQANRFLNETELIHANDRIQQFLNSWNSHGIDLSAEIKIIHNLFVVVVVDEMKAKASGCSIDKSVQLIRSLESELNVELTGRTTVAYLNEENKILFKNFLELRKLCDEHKISNELLMFNNLISTLDDLNNRWKISFKESWLNQIPV